MAEIFLEIMIAGQTCSKNLKLAELVGEIQCYGARGDADAYSVAKTAHSVIQYSVILYSVILSFRNSETMI